MEELKLNALAHKIWVIAQLLSDEGVEDGVKRIKDLLKNPLHNTEKINEIERLIKEWELHKAECEPGDIDWSMATSYIDGLKAALKIVKEFELEKTQSTECIYSHPSYGHKSDFCSQLCDGFTPDTKHNLESRSCDCPKGSLCEFFEKEDENCLYGKI